MTNTVAAFETEPGRGIAIIAKPGYRKAFEIVRFIVQPNGSKLYTNLGFADTETAARQSANRFWKIEKGL